MNMTEGAAIKRRELKAQGARVWRPEGTPPPALARAPRALASITPARGLPPCPQFRKTLTATLTGLQSNRGEHRTLGTSSPRSHTRAGEAPPSPTGGAAAGGPGGRGARPTPRRRSPGKRPRHTLTAGRPARRSRAGSGRASWRFSRARPCAAAPRSRSQKKMKWTKHVRFQEEVNVAKESTSQTADTQDTTSVTEVALALAEDVIAAAVQSVKEAENPIKNIDWVTHGEFSAERGRKQIEQFVLKWEYHSRWVHYTDFLRREDMGHSFHYIYCVRWSIPTAQIPIAQITAGVYFTIKIHKKKPPDTPIDVSYVFEGQSLVHRPGMIRFRDKWLSDIIEAKCILINPNMFQFNSIGIFQNIVGLDF
nr:A-kinase anchor protein 14 isoform X1 [Vicugna pacos]